MEIRNFNRQYSQKIVDFINETNNLTGTSKEISLTLFSEWLNMPSVDPEKDYFIAFSDGEIIGTLHMMDETLISRSVAVQTIAETNTKKKVLEELIPVAVEYAKAKRLPVLHIQSSSGDRITTSYLTSSGFKKVKTYLDLEWSEEKLQDLQLPENYTVRSFVLGEDDSVLTDLQNIAFSQHWGFCPNSIEEIRKRVRMERSRDEGIIFIESKTSIAGYNWTLLSENVGDKVGWVSMTGIHPDFRRNRLGRAVVLAGMHSLYKRGAKSIELEVDSENIPAKELYRSLGFKPISSKHWYEKHIDL